MGVGVSILLFATGAVLTFALKVQSSALDVDAVGIILMLAGVVGFVVSLFMWSSWGGFGWGPRVDQGRTVIRDREIIERRRADDDESRLTA